MKSNEFFLPALNKRAQRAFSFFRIHENGTSDLSNGIARRDGAARGNFRNTAKRTFSICPNV